MSQSQFERTALLLGEGAVAKLRASRVAVFGVGGVGGFAVEALARAGIGTLDLIDHDTVSVTNLNRQIVALHSTIGKLKVDVAAERIHDICPDTAVNAHRCFYLPETAEMFDFAQYDYVIDAIDTVSGKMALIERAKAARTPIICAMGAGNKLDPTRFQVEDISKTQGCPLAKVIRLECRKRGIRNLKVVYSDETPIRPANAPKDPESGKVTPGSLSFVPSVMGLILAGEVIKDLTRDFH